MGTEGYMAPEQSRDASQVDTRADLYGLGVTLWVMLAAQDPVELFRKGSFDAVPEALRRVIHKAISFDPDERHANARALAMDLDASVTLLPGDPECPPLIQDVPSEVDDFGEISLIVRRSRSPLRTDDSGLRPAVLGYVMPAYQQRGVHPDPDWIVEEARREPVQTYAISPAPTMSPEGDPPFHAPPLPSVSPRRPHRAHEDEPVWNLGPAPLLFLMLPAVAGVVALLVVATVSMTSVGGDVERASVAFQRVLNEDFVVLDALGALGADTFALESQWDQVVYAASELDREREALIFADRLEGQADRVAVPGSETWARARASVERIALARDTLLDAHRAYRAKERLLGPFAVGVDRPPIPPPPSPVRGAGRRGVSVERE